MEGPDREEERHPLLIPKILHRLFLHLGVEELKACREVCRIWHPEATTILSTRIQGILLHDKVDWKKFLKLLTKISTSPKLTGLNHCHPFHSFMFLGSYPESATPYKTAILDYMHAKYRMPRSRTYWDERFYSTYGSQINELKFTQFNLNSDKALREFREILSTNCPNLTVLTLQFQRDVAQTTSTPSPTPTPTPSPSPQAIAGSENVFFPPNIESQRKTLGKLKKFTLTTDNRSYMNPHAVEELMLLMPSLEEFTYRYTGAKKQWTLMRKVDIIDILCNIINAGHYSKLNSIDLDSNGTVLSGEDFKKISALQLRVENKIKKFCCQVFIKNEQDWEYFCLWLVRIHRYLQTVDIQVRTNYSQLPSEQELPEVFQKVRTATLLLDNNVNVFLRRMPHVEHFSGVYDNELFPFHSASQALSPEEEGSGQGGGDESSESNNYEKPSCPSAKYLRIHGNEEFMLDIEWKAKVFCNIETFETDIYFDHELRLIWTHLQRIKRLILHLKTALPEQAFTGAGVPPITSFDSGASTSSGSGSSGKRRTSEEYYDRENMAVLEEYPHMGRMKNLETLEIYTGSRQDAFGTQFSASIIIYGIALIPNLKRVVLPPAIPPKCLKHSLRFLANLRDLQYLAVCDDTFKSVLPFHALKMDLPQLEIVVRYYQPEIKRITGNAWKTERLVIFYRNMDSSSCTSDIQLHNMSYFNQKDIRQQ